MHILAWGINNFGQFGNGQTSPTFSSIPVAGPTLANVIALATGSSHSFALTSDCTVRAWGNNSAGQLGNGQSGVNVQPSPTKVIALPPAQAVLGGTVHSLAVAMDGTVWAWGENPFGQLGIPVSSGVPFPIQVPGLSNAIAIYANEQSSFAIESDGTLWAWGGNSHGQLGVGSLANFIDYPVQVAGLGPVREVGGGLFHILAVTTDGKLWAWGYNQFGQLGDSTTTDSNVPILIPGLLNHRLGSGRSRDFSRTLAPDGMVWTWGSNAAGQLGNPAGTNLPQPVPGLEQVTLMGGGLGFSFGIQADGSIWSWGQNTQGQLGDGTQLNSGVPVRVLASASDPPPPDQGNVLRAVKQLPGDVLLDFTGAPATAWRLYRDADPLALGSTELKPDANIPSFLDSGAIAASPSLLYYRVKGLSACFHEAGP